MFKNVCQRDKTMRERKKERIKICFAASSGGHFEQLLMLKPLMEKYEGFLVTEKTVYNVEVSGVRMYYLHQVNRRESVACWPEEPKGMDRRSHLHRVWWGVLGFG